MSNSKSSGKPPRFSDAECKAIAARYDGSSKAIDALLREFHGRDVRRHHITKAAKRGGYRSARVRKDWTPGEDAWMRENWHTHSPEEVAHRLGRSVVSVLLRKRRIRIGRYDGTDLTIRDLEAVLRLDHRFWQEFIRKGWLRAWQRKRQGKVSPITRVSIESLHAFLRAHPEVIDYRHAGTYASGILELAKLPDPPRHKQLRCDSRSFTDCVKPTPNGLRAHAEQVELREIAHQLHDALVRGARRLPLLRPDLRELAQVSALRVHRQPLRPRRGVLGRGGRDADLRDARRTNSDCDSRTARSSVPMARRSTTSH